MKYILSFFMLLLNFHLCTFLFGETNWENKIYSGIQIDSTIIKGRVFSTFQRKEEDTTFIIPTSWALMIKPLNMVSIHLGSLSYSGIWPRYTNPSPNKITPLKQSYTFSNKLITALPSKNTNKIPSGSITFNLPHFSAQVYTSLKPSESNNTGAGVSLSLKKKLINASATFSWRMTDISFKDTSSWYTKDIFFKKDVIHTFAQDISMKTPFAILLVSSGFTQMPFNMPLGFLRIESSMQHKAFLLNANAFFCDNRYLDQSTKFHRNTMHVNLNPQLRLNFYGSVLRAINVGFSSKLELRNGEYLYEPNEYSLLLSIGAEIKLLPLSIVNSLSISELTVQADEKEIALVVHDDTRLEFQSKIRFYPWYGRALERIWNMQCLYEQSLLEKDMSKTTKLKGSLALFFPNEIFKDLEFDIFSEVTVDLLHIRSPEIDFGISGNTSFHFSILDKLQKLQISAQLNIEIQENQIQKIASEISIVLKL